MKLFRLKRSCSTAALQLRSLSYFEAPVNPEKEAFLFLSPGKDQEQAGQNGPCGKSKRDDSGEE